MADYYSKHTGLSIDTAVDKAHAHDNKDILDLIKELPAVQYSTHYDFPNVGDVHSIYIDKTANKAYRWDDDERKYYVVGSNYEDIKVINGGEV